MSEQTELLPCPFCGREVELQATDCPSCPNSKIYTIVWCERCYEAFFKGLNRDWVVKQWNRRIQSMEVAHE